MKYLQRRLLFLRLGGTTKTAPDREPADATLEDEVSEEREVALKVLVEVVVCPEAIKKDQSNKKFKQLKYSLLN